MASGIVAAELHVALGLSPYSEEDPYERVITRLNGIRAISKMVIAASEVGVSRETICDTAALLELLADEIEIDTIRMDARQPEPEARAAA